MTKSSDPAQTVHVISQTEKAALFLSRLLPAQRFAVLHTAESAESARAALKEASPAIAVLNAPFPDENGVALARELALSGWGVLLLVPAASHAAVCERLLPHGVLVLARPADKGLLFQAVYLLAAGAARLQSMAKENATLLTRIDDVRFVDRAKLLLMQHLGMNENEAHRYIEKTAMDRGLRRRSVAENIIRTYED